jgi:hypothetical protein
MRNFKELRAAAYDIQMRRREREGITAEELETLRQYAQSNPTTNSIADYASGKRLVKAGSSEDNNEG